MSILARLPALRAARRQRVRVPGEVTRAAEAGADAARADRLRLLPRQRRRRAARVVVPPLRLRALVPRRARHAHERGARRAAARSAARAAPPDAAPAAARRADRPLARTLAFTFGGKPVDGVRGRHDRLGALRVGPARVLAQLQVPPAARAALLLGQLPELHDDGRRRAERPRLRRARARRARGRRAQNVLGSLDRDLLAVIDKIGGPFTPVGFYYRTMIRPRRLWPLYEKLLRNVAGLGRVDEHAGARAATTPSTAASTCSSSAAAARGARPRARSGRGQAGAARRRARARGTTSGVRGARARACARRSTRAGSSRSTPATSSTASAPSGSSSRRARSSSRSSSRATTSSA